MIFFIVSKQKKHSIGCGQIERIKKRLDLWKKNVSIVHFMALSMVAIPLGHIYFSAAAATAVVAMAFVIKVKVLHGLCCTWDAANFIQTFLLVRINREWWSHFGDCTIATNMCAVMTAHPKTIYSIAPIEWYMTTWTVEMRCSAVVFFTAWSIVCAPSSMAQRHFKCSQNIIVNKWSCWITTTFHSIQF